MLFELLKYLCEFMMAYALGKWNGALQYIVLSLTVMNSSVLYMNNNNCHHLLSAWSLPAYTGLILHLPWK